jgi:pimeloyl-ACP methyl ester carboxylesterase
VPIAGVVTLTDHLFSVPLDHERPDGEHLEIYAREVVATGREREQLPWLLFLQGGPGMRSPRPVGRDSWLDRALDDYRVLLLDQRGTGRSSPITRQTLPAHGEPAAQKPRRGEAGLPRRRHQVTRTLTHHRRLRLVATPHHAGRTS